FALGMAGCDVFTFHDDFQKRQMPRILKACAVFFWIG
ncbi:MAG: hypothetical protein QOI97_1979, partial [Pseudomonas sp.]|nr:hypothetical protein [Pseudomonas sp.]